jgi:uncharacterized protein YhaN
VKLTSLHIERFGTRSHLQLEGLSDQLNVVYGPNGSGKTTIINFVRWMLYGSHDDSSRRFLLGGETRLGGTLSLIDGHQQRRRVERYYDAARGDQVRVLHEGSPSVHAIDPRRLTGVSLHEYGQVFCFGFDQPPSLERLLDVTQSRDLALAFNPAELQRLNELTARLEELRRGDPSWRSDDSLAMLQERRRQLQDDLSQAERRHGERRRQWQQECDALAAEIATDRHHLDSLQAMLRRTEATLETRRGQIEQANYAAQQTRTRWLDERRQEVAEIDYQLQQWNSVLESVRQRQDALQAQLSHRTPQTALSSPVDEADLRVFLRSLNCQIEDIEQDYREWEAASGVRGAARSKHVDARRLGIGTPGDARGRAATVRRSTTATDQCPLSRPLARTGPPAAVRRRIEQPDRRADSAAPRASVNARIQPKCPGPNSPTAPRT